MKYFFVKEKAGRRHIVVAASLENAEKIVSDLDVDNLYELTEDVFPTEGFLISDKE